MRTPRFGGASPPSSLEQYWATELLAALNAPDTQKWGGAFQGLEAPSLEGLSGQWPAPGLCPSPTAGGWTCSPLQAGLPLGEDERPLV